MKEKSLPPRFAEIANGEIKWARVDGIDFDLLGYFLCIHLTIEHYLDQFLKIVHPDLDWDASRQTFGQKISLMTKFKTPPNYDVVPAIKHLNSLRNRISHTLEIEITPDSLLPLAQCLRKAFNDEREIPSEPKDLLERFTDLVCAFFAGYISAHLRRSKTKKA